MGLKKESPEENITLSEIIANKICGGHNQHCIIFFEGKTGAGKSYASLRLAFDVSLQFAKRLGGRPEKYFNIDHVGILTGEETIRIAKNIEQYGIYILDDAGAEGLSARNWQSDQNEVMTKLLQTFRTNNNLLIMSSPDKSFVDKIARTLLHYKVTMTQAYYNQGITLGKLSTVKKISTKDNNTNLYPFLRAKGVIFNYVQFTMPPEWITKEYDLRRKRIEREMNLKAIEEFEGTRDKAKLKEQHKLEAGINKASEDEKRKNNARLYKSFIKEGMKASEALEKACGVTGAKVSQRTVVRDYEKFFGGEGKATI
ncbi:hypothetical protein [Methanosarcina sp. UBA289]|uniref:hypothetical protein n=1 Tax=Methanosarcina sp. UBA289 TaxID=1915574 RepID=UPI0025F2ABCA|nr:hypothetical protein [Methanosarcina sp. UBA289]